MSKPKKKLTSEQKAYKKKRRQETMIVFINGKQKRVKRPSHNNEMDEFERNNADAMYSHINEEWWNIAEEPSNSKLVLNDKGDIEF